MLRWLPFILIPFLALAEDRWIEIRSGPSQVLSNAGDRPAREVLNELEQVRYIVGAALGKENLKSTWPFRVLVFKAAQRTAPVIPALTRDTYVAALMANTPIPPKWLREYVRILIEANSGRMPAGIESGMEEFYSTAQANGTRVTLGAPPPGAASNLDWARIHLLVTSPEYAGRLRVLLYNLQHGADREPAFKNAFMKTAAEIDQQAVALLKSGAFPTVTLGGRPLNPLRDFTPRTAERTLVSIALADIRLAGGADARSEYQSLVSSAPAEAHEGLGLIALREKREDEARKEFAAATAASSKSAGAWLHSARLDPDPVKARTALRKAAELNTSWAEPYATLAAIETDPSQKLQWFKTAASIEPRNAAYWVGAAELYQTHNKYSEAAKAWAAAEDASVDEAERERIRTARRGIEEHRLEYEAAERKRLEDERQSDLQRVKDAALAEVHAAEDRANRAHPPMNPNLKIVPMEIPDTPSGKVKGTISRIDCIGRVVRLTVRTADGKVVHLLISNAQNLAVLEWRRPIAEVRRRASCPHRFDRVSAESEREARNRRGSCDGHLQMTRLRWVVLGVFVLSSGLNYLDRQLLPALAPGLRDRLGLSNADYGLILAAFSITYAVSAPLAGWFIDRVGLNLGVSLAVGLWSLAGATTGFTRGLGGLLACRALLGIAQAGGVPAAGKAIAKYLRPEERALGNAVSQLGLGLGAMAAPPLGLWLAGRGGWPSAFIATGTAGLLWIPLWNWMARRVPAQETLRQESAPRCRRASEGPPPLDVCARQRPLDDGLHAVEQLDDGLSGRGAPDEARRYGLIRRDSAGLFQPGRTGWGLALLKVDAGGNWRAALAAASLLRECVGDAGDRGGSAAAGRAPGDGGHLLQRVLGRGHEREPVHDAARRVGSRPRGFCGLDAHGRLWPHAGLLFPCRGRTHRPFRLSARLRRRGGPAAPCMPGTADGGAAEQRQTWADDSLVPASAWVASDSGSKIPYDIDNQVRRVRSEHGDRPVRSRGHDRGVCDHAAVGRVQHRYPWVRLSRGPGRQEAERSWRHHRQVQCEYGQRVVVGHA